MTLDDLVGVHVVDGVGEYIAKSNEPYKEDVRVFLLRIDGRVHVFREDADDGYRSMLGAIDVLSANPADEIAACEVARDLIEDGDPDPQILARLLSEAPNRLAVRCPACDAGQHSDCFDLDTLQFVQRTRIPVPHHTRLAVHLDISRVVPFEPITCRFVKRAKRQDSVAVDDVLVVSDRATGSALLEIGTEDTDDYYPSFISRWTPPGKDEHNR